MNLILWRHAEAEEGAPDSDRRLTKKGRKQAVKMAVWLNERVEGPVRVLVSPAVRAQETAEAFQKHFETVQELDVNSSARRILCATGWPNAEGTVVVVGHQPSLGRLCALLLSRTECNWDFKKGAVWWFESQGGIRQPLLRAVMTLRHI